MSNAPPIAQMRAQFDSLLDAGWGESCTISRLSGTTDALGHVMGSFVTISAGERVWIQANSGRSKLDEVNLDAETTHFAYQKYSGTTLFPKDRILSSGDVFAYDVIRAHVFESHRMAELKQDLRRVPVFNFLLLEAGSSHLLLEDGTSKVELEVVS